MLFARFNWIKCAILVLVTCCAWNLQALADFREDISRDLGVKNATLVAPAGNEWLIDLDAASGIQTGDLFAVITKGAPVVHPVTKQVIGSLDETRAVLRVTRVKSGYSYVEIVTSKGELRAGDQARRFAGFPAIFWDYSGKGEGVFTQLQAALPELHWQNYAAAQANRPDPPRPVPGMEPSLIFILNDQGLGVKDQSFAPLRFYSLAQIGLAPMTLGVGGTAQTTMPTAPAPSGASIVMPGGPTSNNLPGNTGSSWLPNNWFGGSSRPSPAGTLANSNQSTRGGLIVSQMDSKEGVWYGPRMEGKAIGIDVADVDGDGKNEMILGFKDRVVLARVIAGKFEPLADYSLGLNGDALTLDAIDLNKDGRSEICLSVIQMNNLSSQVLEFQNGKLEAVVTKIPYFLRKVHLPNEGIVLLGQEINPDVRNINQDLAGPIFRVSRNGDQVVRGAPLDLPGGFVLFSFQPFEAGGRPLLARLTSFDKMQVLEMNGNSLWESSDYFGGSETSFERPDGMPGGTTRYVYLQARLDLGPDGTVLVPVNEGSRVFGSFRNFNNSHLKAVTFDGYSLVERWRTKPQGAYLADFRMADADNDGAPEIVMLVMYGQGGLSGLLKSNSGSTVPLIYEMQ